MFEEIVKNATIFSVKKIIKNSMNSYLHVKDYQEEVVRDFDKKKNYLLLKIFYQKQNISVCYIILKMIIQLLKKIIY